MPEHPHAYDFGRELRRLRLGAGLTLTRLAALVHYSKGQLSKVETGHKRPSPQLARLCDSVLDAGGALTALVPEPAGATALPRSSHDGEVWSMHLGKCGSSWFEPMGRREIVTAGASSALALGIGRIRLTADAEGSSLVQACQALFAQFRRLGQTSGPGVLLPALIAQTHSIEQLAVRSGPGIRRPLLVLAARYAEYTGWMAQESGNDEAALWWTDRAVDLATAGDDRDLATYALARRALICLFRGDTSQAAELAERALRSDAPPRIRGLAAQKLAQCHAVIGDHTACMHSLDRARELLAQDSPDPATPVIGASHLPDVVSMFTGWCLYELGRPHEAAAALDRETVRIPSHALRTRSRYGVRGALAYATAGEIDHACELAHGLVGPVGLVDSSTITTDLRRLGRVLARYPRNASVRALSPELTAVLAVTTS